MSVEVKHEPPPPPREGARISGGAHILLVKEATGEIVNEITTPYYSVNERRLRESRKY